MPLPGSKACGCDGACNCNFIAGDDHLSVVGDGENFVITFGGIAYDNTNSGVVFDGLGTDTDPLCATFDLDLYCENKNVVLEANGERFEFGSRLSGGSALANPALQIDDGLATGDVVLELCVEVCLPCPVEGIWARYTTHVSDNLDDSPGPGVDGVGLRMVLINPVSGAATSFFHNDYLEAEQGDNTSTGSLGGDVPFNGMRFFPYALPAGVHEFCFEYRITSHALNANSGFAYLNQSMVSIMTSEGVCK